MNVFGGAIVPCAGLGKRLREIRPEGPKETVLLRGRPLVRYAVEEAFRAGLDRVVLVLRPGKEEVLDYFRAPGPRRELRIDGGRRDVRVAWQETPTGLADALRIGRAALRPGPVAMLLPDNVYDGSSIEEILPAFRETGRTTAGLLRVPREDWDGFGNCGGVETEEEGGHLRVRRLSSKGSGPFRGRSGEASVLRWYGRVILTPRFFTLVDETAFAGGAERDDVPVLQRLIDDEGVTGVPLRGRGFDVGNPEGIDRAERWLARRAAGETP